MTPEEILDCFFEGKTRLFFLVPKDKATHELESKDFVREKRVQGLGILCWEDEMAALRFLGDQAASADSKVLQLAFKEFDDLMEKNDPGRRSFDGFFLRAGNRLDG